MNLHKFTIAVLGAIVSVIVGAIVVAIISAIVDGIGIILLVNCDRYSSRNAAPAFALKSCKILRQDLRISPISASRGVSLSRHEKRSVPARAYGIRS